jgi:SAM-dependent methyltransferase
MERFKDFFSIFGRNWTVGRYLFPILNKWGQEEREVILDLGCGDSPFRCFFSDAKEYIRVDRITIDKEVIKGDVLNIPCANNSVNTVLLFQVLADLPQPILGLQEIWRVMKPGGHLIVFESMCYPEHDMPDDYFRIMPAGIEYLAIQVGFQSAEIIRLGGLFSRFAILWNTYLMGQLNRWFLTKPLAVGGTVCGNLICSVLNRILPNTRLAPDYIARFTK